MKIVSFNRCRCSILGSVPGETNGRSGRTRAYQLDGSNSAQRSGGSPAKQLEEARRSINFKADRLSGS